MKRITIYGFSALMTLSLLAGCVKDDRFFGTPQADGTQVNLAVGDMRDEEIATRSAVSKQECMIWNLSVLLFDKSTGKYKEGEEVDVRTQLSGSNGDRLRTLTMNLLPAAGDRIVVVANYERKGALTEGSSTVADINSVYMGSMNSVIYPFDDGLPMSGEMIYSDSDVTCRLYHSCAKVQVRLADKLTVDGKAVTIDNTSFGIVNHLMANSVLVYGRPEGPIALNEKVEESDFTQRTPINTIDDATWKQEAVTNRAYPAEYPSATYARSKEVDRSEFDADRVGLLLRIRNLDGDNRDDYYRLDFSRQLRSTGPGQSAANEYLDIRRGTHYVFLITKIKSRGYRTDEEAKANPGTNIEYTVTIEKDGWEGVSSNGQYAVKTNYDSCYLLQNVSEPADLLKFAVQLPDAGQKPGSDLPESVSTCRISLVGEDKEKSVPADWLQLCRADGSFSGNSFDLSGETIPEEGYQLKYKSGDKMPTEKCYVKIQYGNIRHYVPVGFTYLFAEFDVLNDHDIDYRGDSREVNMKSYVRFGRDNLPLPWTRDYPDADAAEIESWLSFPESGRGGIPQYIPIVVQAQTPTVANPHNDILKAAVPVSGTYDLSTKGGTTSMNTANCYVINAPGKYCLPLVYGNAIKDGRTNAAAYTSTATGGNILQIFVNHRNAAITSPYIYENAGCTPDNATLVWQDAENLVTNVALSSDRQQLTFEVPKTSLQQGNAIVAVRDASNTILWSWHIWVTDYVPGLSPAVTEKYDPDGIHRDAVVTNYQNERYTFMGVNLGWCDRERRSYEARSVKIRFTQAKSGAVATMTITQVAYQGSLRVGDNPYFQFGRKDPMLPILSSAVTSSVANKEIEDKSCYSENGYAFDPSGKGHVPIGTAIQNPHVFYNYSDAATTDWCDPAGTVAGKTSFLNLWNANNSNGPTVKTIYDPSPVGYCVPPENVYTGVTYNGVNGTDGMFAWRGNTPYTDATDVLFNAGWVIYCNKMPGSSQHDPSGGVWFVPNLGCRFSSTGLPYDVQNKGYYWPNTSKAADFGRSSIEFAKPFQRALGFSVRPIREQ